MAFEAFAGASSSSSSSTTVCFRADGISSNQGVGFLFASWDARAAEHHPVRDAMPELEILLDEETATRTSEDPEAEAFVIPQKKPWEY